MIKRKLYSKIYTNTIIPNMNYYNMLHVKIHIIYIIKLIY
jgi:hypothetical protein